MELVAVSTLCVSTLTRSVSKLTLVFSSSILSSIILIVFLNARMSLFSADSI